MPVITLTTDFGHRDGYVGAMKGVIARIAPGATVVDIAHDIPRGDVAHAAWVVATSTLEFPDETVHVVVVDPGVGGARRGIVGRTHARPPRGEQYYIGPDNGVFGYVTIDHAYALENMRMQAREVSATFHGRDVFAHAAAHLVSGAHLSDFGPRVELAGRLPWGRRAPGTGRVVHIDHYGNLITDLPRDEVRGVIRVGDDIRAVFVPLVRTYEDVKAGELLAYIGSAGTVEIAVRDGSADTRLDAERGTVVEAIDPPAHNIGPYR